MSFKKIPYTAGLSILILSFLLPSIAFPHEGGPKDAAAKELAPKEPASKEAVSKDATTIPGGTMFNACFYCHSLKPDVHLTGPSLAGVWGKKAGTVKGFELYSDALKKSDVTWNEKALEDWIHDTQKVVSGTTMPDTRITDANNIKSLVAFLKIAMAKGGYEKVISKNLIKEKIAIGQLPKHISEPDRTFAVMAIDSCGQVYSVVLADGSTKKIWKFNLGFKVLSGDLGVKENLPMMSPSGSMGDRFEIVFHSFKELSAMITECKSK